MIFVTPRRKINLFCGPDDPANPNPSNPNPNPAPANPNPAPANPNPTNPNPGSTVFTQEQLNAFLAKERRGLQDKLTETTKQLEQIRDSANTTQEQRDALQSQIDELQSAYQTKEQQATEAYKKLQKKYETEVGSEKENANRWRSRFENQLTNTEITRHAASADAYDVDQVAAILLPKTKVVERQEDGKPTGEFVSQVDFTVKGSDGKLIPMKLTIEDAVKAMKEWPEKYGNLFKTKANGGLGGDNVPSGQKDGKAPELKPETTMDDYMKMRSSLGVPGADQQ